MGIGHVLGGCWARKNESALGTVLGTVLGTALGAHWADVVQISGGRRACVGRASRVRLGGWWGGDGRWQVSSGRVAGAQWLRDLIVTC